MRGFAFIHKSFRVEFDNERESQLAFEKWVKTFRNGGWETTYLYDWGQAELSRGEKVVYIQRIDDSLDIRGSYEVNPKEFSEALDKEFESANKRFGERVEWEGSSKYAIPFKLDGVFRGCYWAEVFIPRGKTMEFYEITERESTNPSLAYNGGDYSFWKVIAVKDGEPVGVSYRTSADFDYCPICGNFDKHLPEECRDNDYIFPGEYDGWEDGHLLSGEDAEREERWFSLGNWYKRRTRVKGG